MGNNRRTWFTGSRLIRRFLRLSACNFGNDHKQALALVGLLFSALAVCADDELPTVEFSARPGVNYSGLERPQKPDAPGLGLRIEGDLPERAAGDGAQPAKKSDLGLVMLGDGSGNRVLYEDEHHRVIANPARPFITMMYRYDPGSTDWMFDGNVVRGHVARGSKFGWSVAVNKPLMAVMDWSAKPNVAAIIIYEKTPNSIRGWKKRYEVVADNPTQAKCMGGLDASKWLAKWSADRGMDCGVRTLEGTQATQQSIQNSQR